MRVRGPALAGAIAAVFLTLLAPPSGAQDNSRQRAPTIRVYSQSGPIASRYVTPAIELSEDAYVFAVSFDLDGQIQVLHPYYPEISVKILSHTPLRLPNFFAGFSRAESRYDASGRYVTYPDSYAGSEDDARGSVIALASRVPFNLGRLESGGDWNISAIRRLIEHRSPASAAQALAAYIGAKGERIGFDFMRFAAAQYHDSYASIPLYSCDLYYGSGRSGAAFSRLAVLDRVEQLRRGGRSVAILGYDLCGMPIVAYGPSQGSPRYLPHVPRDSTDTADGKKRIPRGRSAQSSSGELTEAADGTFPMTLRGERIRAGDVFIAPLPPPPTRRDPREIFNNPLSEDLLRESAERGRARVERNAPSTQTPMIGTFPTTREYPRPIVREAPPPRPAAQVHPQPVAAPVPPPKS
jgi:hypothetical protein